MLSAFDPLFPEGAAGSSRRQQRYHAWGSLADPTLTTPNALTACDSCHFIRPPVEPVCPRHAVGEAAVGHQTQQSWHLRKKICRRRHQGLLGNNSLSCWLRLLQSVCELRWGRVCLRVWAPRRLELRDLNGNINANQPFNLYKRNRGRRGRRAVVPLTCGCECGRCSICLYLVFFVFSPPGTRHRRQSSAENVYSGFKAAVFVFIRADNSTAHSRGPKLISWWWEAREASGAV